MAMYGPTRSVENSSCLTLLESLNTQKVNTNVFGLYHGLRARNRLRDRLRARVSPFVKRLLIDYSKAR